MSDENVVKTVEFTAIKSDDTRDFFDEKFTQPLLAINSEVTAKAELTLINNDTYHICVVVSSPKKCMGFVSKHIKQTIKAICEKSDVPFTEEQIKKSFEDLDPKDKKAFKNRVVIPDDVWNDTTSHGIYQL